MTRLQVKNVGPVADVNIILNRHNVFIGKQSSGKSTIAKIISNCKWLEKEVLTHPSKSVSSYEDTYRNGLVSFHNLEGYFSTKSQILYESDYIIISYSKGECSIIKKAGESSYLRKKILYVPSERNMVVYTDSIGGANNLRSFAADWMAARDFFDETHKQIILDLGVEYYKTDENGRTINHIVSTKNTKEYDINLTCGSSGLQSLVPITTTIDFYTGGFYDTGNQEKLLKANDMYAARQLIKYFLNERHITDLEEGKRDIEKLMDDVIGLVSTSSTSFVIEEPENNLFPGTQFSLVNFIMRCVNRGQRYHEATITTHSPYILSSMNILLLAGILRNLSIEHHEVAEIVGDLFIKPNDVSAWAIENGHLVSILDSETGLISENYLDGISDNLAEKFNHLYRLFLKSMK